MLDSPSHLLHYPAETNQDTGRKGLQFQDSSQQQIFEAQSVLTLLMVISIWNSCKETMGDPSDSDKRCSGQEHPTGTLWVCTGCGGTIRDPVVLCVGSDQQWHAGCLRCAECHCPLEGNISCFLRDGRTLCRGDYNRIFAVKCEGCKGAVLPSDLILKAGGHVYHPNCLCCSLCNRLLMPGDHFTLGSQGLCCQAEHLMQEPQICAGEKPVRWKREPVSQEGRRGTHWDKVQSRAGGVRVRTVLSDAQLRMLRSCYSQTPRPDAGAKLRLGQLTGLSPRVIRVWFQNKRCKDKRSSLSSRNSGDLDSMALLYATARPMVVVPPEPLDPALQVSIYESPWQPLECQPQPIEDHEDRSFHRLDMCSTDKEDPHSPAT